MAGMWLSVTVLILIQNVFANICNDPNLLSCDECIRCGGHWCSQKEDNHCTFTETDDFCGKNAKEPLTSNTDASSDDDLFESKYVEKTIYIAQQNSVTFKYKSPDSQDVEVKILNSTLHGVHTNELHVELDYESFQNPDRHICNDEECSVDIGLTATSDFCTNASTTREFIYVQVSNIEEEAMFKLRVPCACECSRAVQRASVACHKRGDYSCGVCSCYHGWSGKSCENVAKKPTEIEVPLIFEFMSPKCYNNGDLVSGLCKCYNGWVGENCSQKKCERSRGDVQCTHPFKNDVTCSGNGECDEECQTCFCYHDRTGSQYFDRNNYCSDICMDTSGCDSCLTSAALGACDHPYSAECAHNITLIEYNESAAKELDRHNRSIWVSCNETFTLASNEPCHVRYVASKAGAGRLAVMVLESCHTAASAGQGGAVGAKAPLIVGILLALAAVAVIGGVVLYKYMHSVPPLPFTDPDYQNIDAEDCTGENPLYKPPTSNYKNPTYGKW